MDGAFRVSLARPYCYKTNVVMTSRNARIVNRIDMSTFLIDAGDNSFSL